MLPYISIPLLIIPFALVGFWTKRPIIAIITATFLAYLIMIIPGLMQTFQAMMIYGTGDPQLMAGGISRTLVSSTLTMFVIVPTLVLFQFSMRRFRREKSKHDVELAGFE